MSEIKVNSIKGVGASTAAITVNNTDGTCTANITNKPNRNLIINGSCIVAQYGSSSTSNGYQTVDRISCSHYGTNESPTRSQSDVASGTPAYEAGFRKAFKVTNGNQTATDAGDHIQIDYFIESQDLAQSGWNYTSSSSYITLSFWIKSSVGIAFPFTWRAPNGSAQVYNMSTGTLTANTWTKVTKTIPGYSNLTINNDNDKGARLMFFPYVGTTYTTNGLTLDTWSAWANAKHGFEQATNWWTTDDATFEITGLQLEVGSVATDFEHRSFGQELALCMRYYAKYQALGSEYAQFLVTSGYATDTDSRGMFHFQQEMRSANPSFTYSNSSHFQDLGGKAINIFQLGDNGGTGKNIGIRCIFSGVNTSNGFSHVIRAANTVQAYFAFETEL